jgi:transcriptional regulator with XRE-family HTH domain
MSQRQLAERSGVDHSTVSRIIRDQRDPSFSTAAKLAHVLRDLGCGTDDAHSVDPVLAAPPTPTTRVERALRADELLSEADIRRIMEAYLALRARRQETPPQARPRRPAGPPPSRGHSLGSRAGSPVPLPVLGATTVTLEPSRLPSSTMVREMARRHPTTQSSID